MQDAMLKLEEGPSCPTVGRDAEIEGEANGPSNPYIFLSQQVKKVGSLALLQHKDL